MRKLTEKDLRILKESSPLFSTHVPLADILKNAQDAIEENNNLIKSFPTVIVSALAGDLEFEIEPETVDAEISDQNVGEQQEIKGTVAGLVGNTGTGDIVVKVTSAHLEGGELELSDVTVGNDDDSDAIATAIVAALVANAQFSADGNSGVIQVTRTDSVITLQVIDEADNDETFNIEVEEGTASFTTPLAISVETEQVGVAAYTRTVKVKLVDAQGNVHVWFTGTVPVTIADNAAGDAEVVGGLNPEMQNGEMEITVKLTGIWAAGNTNTLEVTALELLGETVTAVDSVETSIDT